MVIRLGKFQLKLTSLRLWAGLILGLYFAHVLMPIYWRRPGADACTFGPITNEQYREYRKAAEKELLFAQFWLTGDSKKRAKRLAKAVENVSQGNKSLFHRLAAMHAVMRSLNGQHWQTNFKGDREVIANDAPKIWKFEGSKSRPKNKTYIGSKNKAKTGEDPGFTPTFLNNGSYTPIRYTYSYSTWANRINPSNLFRPFDTPYKAAILPLFGIQETGMNQTDNSNHNSTERVNILSDGFQDNAFEVSAIGPFYPNIVDGIPNQNRWKNTNPYGPCPVIPSLEWTTKFIDQHSIINVRP